MTCETLAFIDIQGRDEDRIYDLHFTTCPDSVWGENWNVCPAGIVPGIMVDEGSCSSVVRISFPDELILASKNTCFSMQDCIDGIIPLAFPDVNEGPVLIDGSPFIARFGEKKENVLNDVEKYGGKILLEYDRQKKADDMIDDLLDNIDDFEF